jgi:hypothetical protein
MKMPFGKYKDKELTEIPKGYLRWLSRQDWVGDWLTSAVAETLGGAVSERPSREPWRPSEGEPWRSGHGWRSWPLRCPPRC